jgi:hypothetical protein
VPSAYIVADEVFSELNFYAEVDEQLESITITEVLEINNALPRRTAPGTDESFLGS